MDFSSAFSPERAITTGWGALKRAAVPILIGSVLLVVSETLRLRYSAHDGWRHFLGPSVIGVLVALGGVVAILSFLFNTFVLSGYLGMGSRVVRGQSAQFEELFSGGSRFLDLMLWQLLRMAILVLTGMVLASPFLPLFLLGLFTHAHPVFTVGLLVLLGIFVTLPVLIYVELGLFLGKYQVVIEGSGPLEALRRSWQMADGHRLWLLFFRVVLFFFSALGLLAMIVGFFATRGIADMGTIGAYLDFTRGPAPGTVEPRLPPMPVGPTAPPGPPGVEAPGPPPDPAGAGPPGPTPGGTGAVDSGLPPSPPGRDPGGETGEGA